MSAETIKFTLAFVLGIAFVSALMDEFGVMGTIFALLMILVIFTRHPRRK